MGILGFTCMTAQKALGYTVEVSPAALAFVLSIAWNLLVALQVLTRTSRRSTETLIPWQTMTSLNASMVLKRPCPLTALTVIRVQPTGKTRNA
eukprot:6336424-Pyramimonas_sp.AAC.1